MTTNTNTKNLPVGLLLTGVEAEHVCVGLLEQAAELFERIRNAEREIECCGASDYTREDIALLRVRYEVLRRVGTEVAEQLRAAEVAQ
jgi:hypothetical protein